MDNAYKIACCVTCTLSDALKRCKVCPFNIGLKEREAQRAALKPALKPGLKQVKESNHEILQSERCN